MNRYETLKKVLESKLQPIYLEVINESKFHNVPKNSETHFKVILVSKKFENTFTIDRHRIVNEILKTEFEQGLHALSLHLFTPKQWQKKQISIPNSPLCSNHKK